MIPELGHLSLVLALMACLLQAAVPLAQRFHPGHALLHLCKPAATAVFLLVSAAFAALVAAYALSDFSVLNVIENSHSSKPLLYKIVGSWGNHEGSMLLWMWVLAACGFLVVLMPCTDKQLRADALAVLALISAAFLVFILFTSNPFLRVHPAPPEGLDLNPLLQDIGLALHPPTLYVGYVGFGVVFAYAIAGLLRGRIDAAWARAVHPWILLPWAFLTLGIAAGSWWAYRELGWGGWWFWDPVENVALLPWLTGTALLHSNMVLMRRGQLARWVALLAILTFVLSLIGTFIVRSGLITSVHAFATDPTRGMFILAYIAVVGGGALTVYSMSGVAASRPVALVSRSGFILINNLLLVAAAAIILIAILYPLALELLAMPGISIGPGYFNATFLPMTAALPVLAALAPLMAWDGASMAQLRTLARGLLPALGVAILIGLALSATTSVLLILGLALGVWLLAGTARYLLRLRSAQVRLRSVTGMRHLASAVAHAGFAIFILGMTLTATMKQTYELPLDASAPMVMGDYTLRVRAAEKREEYNYIARRATIDIARDGIAIATLTPELRFYAVRNMQTTEAALHSTLLRDLYLVLGEATYAKGDTESTLGLRLYVTPAQQWLWIGFLLAAMGGFVALIAALRSTGGTR